jgi:hypothetical protein
LGTFAIRVPELNRSDGYQRNIGVKELDNVMSFIQTPLVAIVAAFLFVLAAGLPRIEERQELGLNNPRDWQ